MEDVAELRRRIMEVLEYDPEMGLFRWKVRTATCGGVFKEGWFQATEVRGEYRRVQVFGKRYRAQRMAWLFMNGEWPSSEVKAVDGNICNTVYSNLFLNDRPKTSKEELSHARLRQLIDYDPETGMLKWKLRINPACKEGWFLGRNDGKQHFTIDVLGRRYQVHQLIWFWMTGKWPKQEIDHENGDGSDNRFSNLREATHQQNMQNCKLRKNNTTGVNGVHFQKGKWVSYISVNSKPKRLGTFATKEEAIAVRKAAEEKYGYHKNHGVKR